MPGRRRWRKKRICQKHPAEKFRSSSKIGKILRIPGERISGSSAHRLGEEKLGKECGLTSDHKGRLYGRLTERLSCVPPDTPPDNIQNQIPRHGIITT